MDVGAAVVWVIRDQRADIVDGAGGGLVEAERAAAGLRNPVRSNSHDLLRFGGIGARIDRLGRDAGQLHPAAEAIWSIVDRLSEPARTLIILHARRAETPAGYDLETRLIPAWLDGPRFNRHGQPHPDALRYAYGGTGANRRPILCRLEEDHTPGFVEEMRQEFLQWRSGLEMIVSECRRQQQRLGRLVVTGPQLRPPAWEMI